jgi:hypothetical protein
LRIWDAATGQPLKGHEGAVYSAAFSPDGRRIVTASDDKTARIWDAATGRQIGQLNEHEGPVYSAAFSPDGKRIVTASEESGRILAVFPDTQALVSRAKEAVPRCLTPGQLQEFYLPPEPPEWCIEMEKWPYNTHEWRQWLSDAQAGKHPSLPYAP